MIGSSLETEEQKSKRERDEEVEWLRIDFIDARKDEALYKYTEADGKEVSEKLIMFSDNFEYKTFAGNE